MESVPIFQGASPAFIEQIIVRLKPEVYPPSHYVIREGEIGNEMYFVKAGQLEAFAEETGQVYSVMKDGAFFGEIALVNDHPRTTDVRTKSFCDLLVLYKRDFNTLLANNPEMQEAIYLVSDQRAGSSTQEK